MSSMAQKNANKTKTANKKYNENDYSTSSDLILLIWSLYCLLLRNFRCNTMLTTALALELWESLSKCVRKRNKTKLVSCNALHACGNHCQHMWENVLNKNNQQNSQF